MQKTTFPPELFPLYPLAEGEKLLPHSMRPDWFGGKYRYSWPSDLGHMERKSVPFLVSSGKRSILDLAVLATVYFPEFRPATLDKRNLPTYGYPPAEGVLRPKLFKEYFLFFHKCSSRTASQFTPFSSRKFGPVWFKKSLDPNFQKLNKPEL
ncbi:hypothetical protein KY289_035363 [Solanum tuberosum]|nr:hypothetical protein KY289_035363 [Solanum tuberosum]